MALPPCPFVEADVEQLSHHMLLPGAGGPSFRLHRDYHPQNNFNFLIICSNSPVPHDMFETQQRSKGSFYGKRLYGVISFLITTFGGYVQVECQSKRKSPFDDHYAIIAAILVSLCLYGVSIIAECRLPRKNPYLPFFKTSGPLVGILVIVLLLYILVSFLGIIASVIWGLFIVNAVYRSFSRIMQYLRQVTSGIKRYFDVSESSDPVEIV